MAPKGDAVTRVYDNALILVRFLAVLFIVIGTTGVAYIAYTVAFFTSGIPRWLIEPARYYSAPGFFGDPLYLIGGVILLWKSVPIARYIAKYCEAEYTLGSVTTRLKLFVAAGTLGLLVISILVFPFTSCALSEAHAKELMFQELSRRGFDPKFLQGPTQRGCSYDFEYEGNGKRISYVVMDNPPRSPAVQSWDYAPDQNGP